MITLKIELSGGPILKSAVAAPAAKTQLGVDGDRLTDQSDRMNFIYGA